MNSGHNSIEIEERTIGLWLCTATPTDLTEDHFQHYPGLWREFLLADKPEHLSPKALRFAVKLMRENDFAHGNYVACERVLKLNFDLRAYNQKTSKLRGARAGRSIF